MRRISSNETLTACGFSPHTSSIHLQNVKAKWKKILTIYNPQPLPKKVIIENIVNIALPLAIWFSIYVFLSNLATLLYKWLHIKGNYAEEESKRIKSKNRDKPKTVVVKRVGEKIVKYEKDYSVLYYQHHSYCLWCRKNI